MRGFVTWCMRKPLVLDSARARLPMTHKIMVLLEAFWEMIWDWRDTLIGATQHLYLMYYIGDIEEISESDARDCLSVLLSDYVPLWCVFV